jgi:hypothetical protein
MEIYVQCWVFVKYQLGYKAQLDTHCLEINNISHFKLIIISITNEDVYFSTFSSSIYSTVFQNKLNIHSKTWKSSKKMAAAANQS